MDPSFRFVEAPSRAGMVRWSYQVPIYPSNAVCHCCSTHSAPGKPGASAEA